MRAVFLALTLGAISMTAAVSDAGQEKKDEGPKAPFKQRVTIKNDGLNPLSDVDAYQYEGKKDKKQYFGIRAGGSHSLAGRGSTLPLKTEIVDAKGASWTVVRVVGTGPVENVRHFEVAKVESLKKEVASMPPDEKLRRPTAPEPQQGQVTPVSLHSANGSRLASESSLSPLP